MMPVVVSWSKGQVPIELNLDLPGSPQLHIYSINLAITQVCDWMVFSLYHNSGDWLCK